MVCTTIGTLVALVHMWAFVRSTGTPLQFVKLILVMIGVTLFVTECNAAKGCTAIAATKLLLTLLVIDVVLPRSDDTDTEEEYIRDIDAEV